MCYDPTFVKKRLKTPQFWKKLCACMFLPLVTACGMQAKLILYRPRLLWFEQGSRGVGSYFYSGLVVHVLSLMLYSVFWIFTEYTPGMTRLLLLCTLLLNLNCCLAQSTNTRWHPSHTHWAQLSSLPCFSDNACCAMRTVAGETFKVTSVLFSKIW